MILISVAMPAAPSLDLLPLLFLRRMTHGLMARSARLLWYSTPSVSRNANRWPFSRTSLLRILLQCLQSRFFSSLPISDATRPSSLFFAASASAPPETAPSTCESHSIARSVLA